MGRKAKPAAKKAKAAKKPTTNAPTIEIHPRIREALAVCVAAASLYVLLSLLTYDKLDPSLNSAAAPPDGIHNLGGILGAYLSDAMVQVFGLGAYVVVVLVLIGAIRTLARRPLAVRTDRLIAYTAALLSTSILTHTLIGTLPLGGRASAAGGVVGEIVGGALVDYVSPVGTCIFAAAILILSTAVATGGTVLGMAAFAGSLLIKLWALVVAAGSTVTAAVMQLAASRRSAAERKIKIGGDKPRFLQKKKESATPAAPPADEPSLDPPDDGGGILDIVREPVLAGGAPKIAKPYVARKSKKKKKKGSAPRSPKPSGGQFGLPELSLLESEEQTTQVINEAALTAAAENLEQKLKDFGIYGRVVEIHPGPVITMYEFEPAAGIKVSKISNLVDDLKMAMRSASVRIIAPLPGKGTVGIEIPNNDREIVYLKDIIGHGVYHQRTTPLPLALGKDIAGKPSVADLTRMPHLLIAGTTGSGKSVAVNSMLISMLYRSTPEDLRLLMIDPKMLEFSMYDGIPHLLLPVITNPKKAAMALKWAVAEMERRYRLLADIGARNISRYNQRIPKILEEREKEAAKQPNAPDPDDGQPSNEFLMQEEKKPLEHGHLPYIVIVIDELADLMMINRSDVEESITRLAQMARAAGIHLMIATQRPSVDVLTGLIKANFPARIAFRVASKTDSRTILDSNGAEELLGDGDMLFKSSNSFMLNRIHGPLVTDGEVSRVVEFLKDQGNPEYDEDILKPQPGDGAAGVDGEEEVDELYDQAIAVVAEHRVASISFVQRKLRVGYNRAARMIEKMESDGIVSAPDGSKGRQVLVQHLPPT